MSADLAVIILTHNESLHLARAIESVRPIAVEIFVIDSGSTDDTVELANRLGATVLYNPFVSHAKQFAWALDNAPITAGWILRLDADEVILPDLIAEIAERLPALPAEVVGVTLDRRHIFLGRWIRHGGRSPLRLMRLWRRGHGRVEDRWMDEHVIIWGGRCVHFRGGFEDRNLKDLTFFTAKHNDYATREAVEILGRKYDLLAANAPLSFGAVSTQAYLKRGAKDGFYNRLPFSLSSLGYFMYRYFVRMGFLDGREGLIYHFLQGYWYRFLVGAKVLEFDRALSTAGGRIERLQLLSRLSGLQLTPVESEARRPDR
jgi:glycosyltransferase involved in cell wall biosynthesis